MGTQRTMSLARLLREFAPVEQLQSPGHDWDAELAWLRSNHPRRMARLRAAFRRSGIEDPIQLCYGHPDCGPERHVVDGHHRVALAVELGIKRPLVADAWAEGADWFMYASDQQGDDPEPAAAGDGPAGDGPAGDGPAGDGPAGDGPAGDGPAGDGPAGLPPMLKLTLRVSTDYGCATSTTRGAPWI